MSEELQNNITLPQILSVYDDNQKTPDELLELKKEFLSSLPQLPENPEEHQDFIENNRELIQQKSDEFGRKLRRSARTTNLNFPPFEEWVSSVNVDAIRQEIENNVANLKLKNPDKEYNVDEILSDKLKYIYHQAAALHKYQTDLGIQNLDPSNPEESYKNFMTDYTKAVVQHFGSQMPETTNNGTLTFVIGYSGAGKSTAIGDAESIPNTPYQVTSDNKLVLDSDNIQPFIPGYAGGVGSQNTSAYAIAAYRKFLESAMAQKKDIVVPIVGGQIDTVVAEIVKAILNDYKVKVQLVNTPAHVSYHNAITRAAMDGKRVFTPIVGPNSNPSRVYETLSGKSAKDESMDETENIAGLQIIENKIKKEILERLGGKKKADPIQQKSLEDKYKNLDQLVTFELIRGPQEPIYNVASNKLKLIKIAAKFEKNNQHFIADALLRVLFKI